MKILDIPRSGSVAGSTSSRNRYGQYVRSRSSPVNPKSSFQGAVRARLALNAAAWRNLTANQRLAWNDLASQMVRTDSLGQSNGMTGFAAYCSVNNNNLAAGNAVISDAPLITTPIALATVTLTLTNAAFSVAYTATPLATGARLFFYASGQRSAGRAYEGDFRLITVSAAAAASPLNVLSAYQARFGTPVTGKRIFTRCRTYLGGFLSGPFDLSQVVA